MPYFGSAPSASALTAAQIDAGAVDSSEIATGAVDLAHLSASGTASSGTYLRGDNSWQAAGGDLSFGGDTFGANKVIGANDAYSLSLETSGNTALTIDATGAVTKPLQPCMLANANAAQANLATGTDHTVVLGNEVFDLGSDFTGNTFTAPVTGKYLVTAGIRLDDLDSSATYYYFGIMASNQDRYYLFGPGQFSNDIAYWTIAWSEVVDMDASDTCHLVIRQEGGTAQADVNNGASTPTHMSIVLVA